MHLTLYPNNEVRARICASPVVRRTTGERRVFKDSDSYLSIAENLRLEFPEACRSQPEASGLRVGYGAKPRLREFSVRARRTIARCGGVLGEPEKRPSTLFLTGTLPGSTTAALEAISCQSSWIVHELLTHLPRLAALQSRDCRWIWVWEFQTRGALHWHCVLQLPDRIAAQRIADGFKSLWFRVLSSAGRRSGVDIAAREEGGTWADLPEVWRAEAEWARKNPARYLAKYVSKLKISPEVSAEFPPTRWYGVSRALLDEMRAATCYASTSARTKKPDHVLCEEVDLAVLERLFSVSNSSRQFADKVRDGHTFVFYVPEEKRSEVEELMREFEPGELEDFVRFGSTSRPVYYGLRECAKHPSFLERLLEDVGSYYRCVYQSWACGERVSDSDMFWLDHYAHQILWRAGWKYQGQPPERSGAGLPGRREDIIESAPPPECQGFDQSALFP